MDAATGRKVTLGHLQGVNMGQTGKGGMELFFRIPVAGRTNALFFNFRFSSAKKRRNVPVYRFTIFNQCGPKPNGMIVVEWSGRISLLFLINFLIPVSSLIWTVQ